MSICCFSWSRDHRALHSFPTRRSSDLVGNGAGEMEVKNLLDEAHRDFVGRLQNENRRDHETDGRERQRDGEEFFHPLSTSRRSEEHTSELQSRRDLVCRLLLEKKKKHK